MERRNWRKLGIHLLLGIMGFIMIYPLIWLFFGSFKTNEEIITSLRLFPSEFVWDSYTLGWEGSGQFTFGDFFVNTFKLVIPTVLFTTFSSLFIAYGFARFRFPFHNVLFALMLSTLMLPHTVVIVPKYILFNYFGWLNSYLPFTIPALLGFSPFYIFLQYQFLRGLPKELDESAEIDGCGSFGKLTRIILPLSKSALVSVAIFQFIWTWNDFFNVLIYVNSVSKYTLSLGLRMMMDIESATNWNQIMAMSVLTMLPCLLFFFMLQRYFVEGIAKTGIKG